LRLGAKPQPASAVGESMAMFPGRSAGRLLVLLPLLLATPAFLPAAEPTIRNIDLRGLQTGGTTTLTLDGDELGANPRLFLPFPVKQELKKASTDKKAIFDVMLGPDVVPGYYHLRVLTDGGISLPVIIAVDGLPQRPLAASAGSLPVALHGTIGGSTVVETRFVGKAGQKVLAEVEAGRLGSKLRPVVHLHSPKKLQLAWSWPTPGLLGDARLEATLPEDGEYTVAVHDAEYAVPGPGFFRLRIGQWSFVDQVFPPFIAKNKPQPLELLGVATVSRLDAPANPMAGSLPLNWPTKALWSGPRPFVQVSTRNELVGQTAPSKIQDLPAGPAGVSGRLLVPFAEDRYRLLVTPGSKVRLEVFAERLGSPLDAALVVRNEKGDLLARADDSPGTLDPVLEYAVPDKTNAILIGVVEAQGRAGPTSVYRLTVDVQGVVKPDFQLFSPTQHLSVPFGGWGVVPVLVERRGYGGPVQIAAEGLPAWAQLEGAVIPEGGDGALVTVRRSVPAGDAAITRWIGRGADGEPHPLVLKGHPLRTLQPWLATEIALAPTTARTADFQLDWSNLPPGTGLVPTQKLVLPVKVTRPSSTSPVRLTLLTSQVIPVANNQPDLNKAIRLEKPLELGPKTAEEKASVLVPVDLPAPVYDVTIKGELLSPDKTKVLAVAYAPVQRLPVRLQLALKVDGPPRITAAVDPKKGATLKVQGQVERREGLAGDVALILTGLPAGVRADPVTVKAGTTVFALNVILPPNQAAGEFRGLKLAGTAVADPKQPNVRVRSRDVELTLVVQAAQK
jgi:hypothetical protein